jgi:hypothetical protein
MLTSGEVKHLPYGKWTCADGTEVLFNRGYNPIWERRPGEAAKAVKPHWVKGIVKDEHFYTDDVSPRRNEATYAECERILADFTGRA